MNLTRLANTRMQQRGFSQFTVDMILQFGSQVGAPGGATKFRIGKREHQKVVSELKKAIQLMDKAKGGQMIVSDDNIITVYKRGQNGK